MTAFSLINKTGSKLALAVVLAASLAACGGSDGPATVSAVSAPVSVAISPATSSAAIAVLVAAKTVTFPSAVTALGTTGAATLTFSAPAAGSSAVPFTLTEGATSSKGTLTFGSCIFTITEQPVGTVLAPAKVVTIPTAECSLGADTTNAAANGSTVNRNVTFTLGGTTSSPVKVPVVVSANGDVSVGGVVIGKGTLVQVTGAN